MRKSAVNLISDLWLATTLQQVHNKSHKWSLDFNVPFPRRDSYYLAKALKGPTNINNMLISLQFMMLIRC